MKVNSTGLRLFCIITVNFMQFTVKKDKDLAFYSFFIRLTQEKERHSGVFDFLEVPSNLIEQANQLKSKQLGEYKSRSEQKVWEEINIFFNEFWDKYQSQLNHLVVLLEDFKKTYSHWLIKNIPKFTSCEWSYDKVIFYPSVLAWAGVSKNLIRIGISPEHFLKKDLIPVIIHELIHINTEKINLSDLDYQHDAKEIADTLIVQEITDSINKEFGSSFRKLKLAVPFKFYEPDTQKLSELIKDKNFSESVRLVDNFLLAKNHQEVYK